MESAFGYAVITRQVQSGCRWRMSRIRSSPEPSGRFLSMSAQLNFWPCTIAVSFDQPGRGEDGEARLLQGHLEHVEHDRFVVDYQD